MLAYIFGEVGTFCTVLLSVSTRTFLPIFIEIGSYSTNTEQLSLHVVFGDTVNLDKPVLLPCLCQCQTVLQRVDAVVRSKS